MPLLIKAIPQKGMAFFYANTFFVGTHPQEG
jgi:hypothetical protein